MELSSILSFITKSNFMNLPIFLLIIQFINVTLDEIKKKKEKNIDNTKRTKKENVKDNIISTIGVISLLVLAFIMIFFVLKIKILEIIITTINTMYLIYILIICPLLNIKLTYNFKEDLTMITSFLMVELICTGIINNFLTITNLLEKEIIFQIFVLIILTIKLLLMFYFFILSFYNIFKNLNYLFLNKLNNKIKAALINIDKKYNLEYLDILFKKSSYFFIIKIILFLFKFFIWIIMILFVRSILSSLYTFFQIINKTFKKEENNIFYILSKISLVISLFVTYCIIIFTKGFNSSIISIFELIISTVFIPLILEMLLSKKN